MRVFLERYRKSEFRFNWFRRSQRQNVLLRRIIDRVRNSLELKVVLQTAVDEIADILQLDCCSFFWYFHDTDRIQVICERNGLQGSSSTSPHHSVSNLGYFKMETLGELAAAIARAELIVQNGERSDSAVAPWLSRWLVLPHRKSAWTTPTIWGFTATAMVPLNTQDGSTGFIACFSKQPRRWLVSEIELLQSIAQHLEVAISQAQLYEQTQKQAQRERLVNQITAQTRRSFKLEEILQGAIAQLLKALQSDRCLVHLVEDPGESEQVQSSSGVSENSTARQSTSREKHLYEVCRPPFSPSVEDFDITGPITHWVIQNRIRVVISNVSADQRIGPHNREYQQAQIKSSLVVPVQTNKQLYAILYLNQCSQIRYWSKNDQTLAQAVADQLAISIQQAHLYAQTQQQAADSAAQARNLAETLHELRLTQTQLIQSEKMSSLGRMVAGVAHEINNPINFIFGNLPYVESHVEDLTRIVNAYQDCYPQPDAELQELAETVELEFILADLPRILDSMKAGADRIRQIVLSLRNFARLDEAQHKIVDIHEGIESSLLVLQSYIGNEIQIVRKYGKLPSVECYPQQLNQALMNILINAVEALNHWQGQEKATIAICTDVALDSSAERAIARIVITDNGPGIPYGVQSKIFDPFFTTKDVGQGTGLGLTISYQIVVNQHGGQLKFYSEPGLGAEFMIEIPISHPSAPDSQKLKEVIAAR
ncbi:MAG: GAF domain-containing protein [Leptolyngbyaceae cyanobacterium RU_5_1]|nr:GAF domain-containing protein [Leptolyngbyaceae cyanobacterium RU_5_1]